MGTGGRHDSNKPPAVSRFYGHISYAIAHVPYAIVHLKFSLKIIALIISTL